MKTTLATLLTVLLAATVQLNAQSTITVEATSRDISYYLDLKAVASVFAEAKNLEDFEMRLNDYDSGISNLDLNDDGVIDYLRVVEAYENNIHLVIIQAVLGPNIYQDVATIFVEREKANNVSVRIIGDPYIYGTYYIIEPVYYRPPVIFNWFWTPRYVRWYSPYYWGYYPVYYHYRPVIAINIYTHNVVRYIDRRHYYSYSNYRPTTVYYNIHRSVSRNDYGVRHPERAFNNRNVNANVTNRRDFERNDRVNTNNRGGGSNVSNNNRTSGARVSGGTSSGTRNENTRGTYNNGVNSNQRTRESVNTSRPNTENGRGTNNNTTRPERVTVPARTNTPNASAPSNTNTRPAATERVSTPARTETQYTAPAQRSESVSRPTTSAPSNTNTRPTERVSTPARTETQYTAPAQRSESVSRPATSAPARTTAPSVSAPSSSNSRPAVTAPSSSRSSSSPSVSNSSPTTRSTATYSSPSSSSRSSDTSSSNRGGGGGGRGR